MPARFVGYEISTDQSVVQAFTEEYGRPVYTKNIGNGKAIYFYENEDYEYEHGESQTRPDSHRDIEANSEILDTPEEFQSPEDEEDEGEEATTAEVSHSREALEDETKTTLYEIASDMDISGRSRMSKDELVDAILAAE